MSEKWHIVIRSNFLFYKIMIIPSSGVKHRKKLKMFTFLTLYHKGDPAIQSVYIIQYALIKKFVNQQDCLKFYIFKHSKKNLF